MINDQQNFSMFCFKVVVDNEGKIQLRKKMGLAFTHLILQEEKKFEILKF